MQVGRGPERRQIEALLSATRLGQSGVLVVVGDPGIGKTALLRFAAERAEGMDLLTITGRRPSRTSRSPGSPSCG